MSYIIFILYLLIGRITWWSLAVTVALVGGRERSIVSMVVISIIVGLIEDIVRVRPLGITSAFLVAISCITWLIESHYRAKWLWWWYGIAIGAEFIFRLILQLPIGILSIIGQITALILVQWITRRLTVTEGIYVGR